MSWAHDELQHANLGDRRLNRRLVTLIETLARHPETSLPQACACWAQTKAAYRFFANERLTPEAILAAHTQATRARLAGQGRILAVQDTTDLTYTAHPATEGLGYLHNRHMSGFFVHSTLALSTDGVPLGLLDQQMWARPRTGYGKKHQRRKRPLAQKESLRWLVAEAASWAHVPTPVEVVLVADREADLYDLFARARPPQAQWLVRAAQDRRSEAGALFAALEQAPVAGSLVVEVGRRGEQPPRRVQLQVRYRALLLSAPKDRPGPSVALTGVLVEEGTPPPGQAPICWRLLTSLPVRSLAEAETVVSYYSRRWLVERFHYVLKSGCRVEALQLQQRDRLERAVASYSIVAWRLLALTYQARVAPAASCGEVLEPSEWQVLWAHHRGVVPAQAPALGEALLLVAVLGGFLGRRGDGPPGVKVLWRGLRRLSDLAQAWRLAQGLSPPLVGNA